MVIAFLRGKNREFSVSSQQDYIIDYAQKNSISIDKAELDNSTNTTLLDNRDEFLTLLKVLKKSDIILIYDLWVFATKVSELSKVFDCIFKHDIIVHICKSNIIINTSTSAGYMLSILSKQREANIKSKTISLGRPKGSFSKSKFDQYKDEIVKMLEEKLSVSEIAKRLGVSRSSLKDYINSRSLKEIVELQNITMSKSEDDLQELKDEYSKKCSLTDN
jgi:DNA invertase Pin-like site-specific DNA recombinase